MNDPFTEYGLKASVIAAGFAGGLLRAISRKRATIREAIASPIAGALAAGYLTGPLIHYAEKIGIPLPPDDGSNISLNAAAFLVGTCGMWIADAIFELVSERLKRK